MDKFDVYLQKAVQLAEHAVTQYGPVAWETTLWLVRIDAIQQLAVGLALLLLAFALTRVAKYCAAQDKKQVKGDIHWSKQTDYTIPFVFAWVFAIPIFLSSLIVLLDVWMWVALFKPELMLAKQALDKIL